jgi:hypothetical protein
MKDLVRMLGQEKQPDFDMCESKFFSDMCLKCHFTLEVMLHFTRKSLVVWDVDLNLKL